MARDRILTDPEKIAASAAFNRAMRACGKTQAKIAEEAAALLPDKDDAFSQGAVWQWANNRLAINAERATAVAEVVGADPEEISVAYRRLAEQIRGAPSQPRRLDRETILAAVRLASGATTGVGLSHFEIETEGDAELFALAIEEVLDDGIAVATDSDVQRFARKVQSRTEAGNGQVGKAGSNGGADRAASKAKARDATGTALSGKRKRAAG